MRNPRYAREHYWEMGVAAAEVAHANAVADVNSAWNHGVYAAEQAHSRAVGQIEQAWASGIQAAEVANI